MTSVGEMSLTELAAFVQTRLREQGIEVILSGGASVTFYSSSKYVSYDVDLVNAYFVRRRLIREAMQRLGFNEFGRSFVHPDTQFFVEFPPGPLAVGKEPVQRIDEYTLSTGTLRTISPTDCVKDRLSNFYHFDDLQCLEQATLVAQTNEIDLNEVDRWSKAEGKLEEFDLFKVRLIDLDS
jgi:hypothetical protein